MKCKKETFERSHAAELVIKVSSKQGSNTFLVFTSLLDRWTHFQIIPVVHYFSFHLGPFVFVHRSPNPLSSPKLRANLTLPPRSSVSNSNSDTLNTTKDSHGHGVHHFMPRSKSSQMISSRLEPPRSPSHHSYLSTNHSHHQSSRGRAKSAVNVRPQKEQHHHHHHHPRVSHHQPCPNHVAGKTFAEMGTQTLPRPKKKVDEPAEENKGCVASLKQR